MDRRQLTKIGIGILGGIYAVHKLAPKNPKKVAFLSRQEAKPVDFTLIADELKSIDPEIETTFVCRTMKQGLLDKIIYGLRMIGPEMHALATSKVAVLDSYSASVSVLKHSDLKVFQIWHAMGALKKFGKSIVGEGEGRSADIAETMNMHGNYDLILASSPESRDAFMSAFGYDEDKFMIGALPRTDLLRDPAYMDFKRDEILDRHPELKEKKIVLYAPTLRISGTGTGEGSTGYGQVNNSAEVEKAKELIDAIEGASYVTDDSAKIVSDFAVIIAPHPVMKDVYKSHLLPEYSTFELLALCDYFVTDYSAVVYEAAIAKKPIILYAYDLDHYKEARGFYLDYENDMPSDIHSRADEVAEEIIRLESSSQNSESSGENLLQEKMKKQDAFVRRYIYAVGSGGNGQAAYTDRSNIDRTNIDRPNIDRPNTRIIAEKIIELMH